MTAWITAASTVGLVVVTFIYVQLTRAIATRAEESARAAARAADAAERAILVSSMPLVAPGIGGGSATQWVFAVYNSGNHAAVNLQLQLHWQGVEQLHPPPQIDRLGPREERTLTVIGDDARHANQAAHSGYQLRVEYQDPFGTWYRTQLEQSVSSGRARLSLATFKRHSEGSWEVLAARH